MSTNIWNAVSGQQVLKNRLYSFVRRRQVSHSYILEGNQAEDRLALARGFAQLLLCENGNGCGECHACRQVENDFHPDLITVRHEKEDHISVEEIRSQLINDIGIRPYQSEYKIYLVDEAEKMNVSAQNALLKTLEEPPAYGVILLLTANSEAFLPTIQSRAVLLRMQEGKENEKITEEEMEPVLSVMRQVYSQDSTSLFSVLNSWKEQNADTRNMIRLFRIWYRDILILKSTGNTDRLVLKQQKNAVREAGEFYTYRQLQEALAAIDRLENRISLHVNEELALKQFLTEIRPRKKIRAITKEEFEDLLVPNEEEALFYRYYNESQ